MSSHYQNYNKLKRILGVGENDFTQILNEVISLLIGDFKRSKIQIVSSLESGLPPVFVERSKIEQLFFVLISG